MTLTKQDLQAIGQVVDEKLNDPQGPLNIKLDAVQEQLDGIDGRLGRVEGRLDRVENRLEGVENKLDRVDARGIVLINVLQKKRVITEGEKRTILA